MSQRPKINNPLSIEKYPIILSRDKNGILRAVPPKKNDYEWESPAKAKAPVLQSIPQIAHSKKDGEITGISLGLSRALLRAGMYHYAIAMEILADLGYQGTALFRGEFIDILSRYFSEHVCRSAFDELSGKLSNRHSKKGVYKQKVKRGRERFCEFVVKIVPNNILILMLERTIFTTKSGRGRPCTAWVYIPTEGELKQLLIAAGLASEMDSLDFMVGISKSLEEVTNLTTYKDFIMGTTVVEKGKGIYARREIGGPVGRHVNTVRKGAERMGIKVTAQDPICRLIRPEDVQLLPVDDEAYKRGVALKIFPPGTHIRDGFGKNSKTYKYTQDGVRSCRENSLKHGGSGKAYKACYSASEYDPSHSRYTLPNDPLVENQAKSSVTYKLDKFKDIVHYNQEIKPTAGG